MKHCSTKALVFDPGARQAPQGVPISCMLSLMRAVGNATVGNSLPRSPDPMTGRPFLPIPM